MRYILLLSAAIVEVVSIFDQRGPRGDPQPVYDQIMRCATSSSATYASLAECDYIKPGDSQTLIGGHILVCLDTDCGLCYSESFVNAAKAGAPTYCQSESRLRNELTLESREVSARVTARTTISLNF